MNLLAGLFLLSAAFAATPARVCHPFPGVGCWFVPDGVTGDPPLLFYIRGHHPKYGAAVPEAQSLASSRQAFEESGLGPIAEATGHALLVTYKSAIPATPARVREFAKQTGFTFSKLVVAAHSGAHDGLGRTLDAGTPIDRLVLLDIFYPRSKVLAVKIAERFPTPGRCAGFVTTHNLKRYEDVYQPLLKDNCPVEPFENADHTPAVARCLASYMAGDRCIPRNSPRR